MSNTKSRSWTFPSRLSPAVGVAPVAFAGCQTSSPAFLCLTFLRTAGEEDASPREEDFCAADVDDAASEEEEVGAAVSEAQYSVF